MDGCCSGAVRLPDFVANAGGIIQVGGEHLRWTRQRIEETIASSTARCGAILEESVSTGATPLQVAMQRALARVREARPSEASPGAGERLGRLAEVA